MTEAPDRIAGVVAYTKQGRLEVRAKITIDASGDADVVAMAGLRTLIARSDPSTALPVNIRTSQPLAPWPTTNVTLLGDAIHTMTPGRGAGANTALRDARLLCKQLVAVRDGQLDLLAAIHGEDGTWIQAEQEAALL